jgi:hypothetical protein
MFELVVIYCLISEPDRCVERRTALEDAVSAFECAMDGQREAIRYLSIHPDWRLSRFTCRPQSKADQPV